MTKQKALAVGDVAPPFTLESTSGKRISLADFAGQKVVLFFYPKDDTPGCTKEACGFRDEHRALRKAGVVVLGVSKDSLASHAKFRTKFELPFDLLVDAESLVAQRYAAHGKKMMYGKEVTGTIRSTFLIDEAGRIAARWSPVKVDGHAAQVLAASSGEVSAAPPRAPSRRRSSRRAP